MHLGNCRELAVKRLHIKLLDYEHVERVCKTCRIIGSESLLGAWSHVKASYWVPLYLICYRISYKLAACSYALSVAAKKISTCGKLH